MTNAATLDAPRADEYVIAPPPVVTLPVRGTSAVYPVRRVYCVGRNYAAHAIEMGHDPNKEPPFFFQKNPDNIILSGEPFPYPSKTQDVHFEIEMVVALGKGGTNIPVESALDHVYGYGVGLDMTRRDLQGEAKKMGRPWEMGKGFDGSAPMSPLRRASEIGHPDKGTIRLSVNGTERQNSDLSLQIWNVPATIAYLSRFMDLKPGDLIMTGTPENVAAVVSGDTLEGAIEGVGEIRLTYA